MENPSTWGEAESVVQSVLNEDRHQRAVETITGERSIGLSLTRRITDALREAGLLACRPDGCPRGREET